MVNLVEILRITRLRSDLWNSYDEKSVLKKIFEIFALVRIRLRKISSIKKIIVNTILLTLLLGTI